MSKSPIYQTFATGIAVLLFVTGACSRPFPYHV
jgi:hypothetical protein